MNTLYGSWFIRLATRSLLVGAVVLVLSACGGSKKQRRYSKKYSTRGLYTQNVTPQREYLSKTGNPPVYQVFGKKYRVLQSSQNYVKRGIASWYGKKFHGKKTSSGEIYNMYKMTAAHKTLPIPTYVRVTNLQNGRTVIVRVNDRGPFVANREIDLSHTAANKLGILGNGTGLVEVRALAPYQIIPAHKRTLYARNPDDLPKDRDRAISLNQYASNTRRSSIPTIETDPVAAARPDTAASNDQGFVTTVVEPDIRKAPSVAAKSPFNNNPEPATSQRYAQANNTRNRNDGYTSSRTWKQYRPPAENKPAPVRPAAKPQYTPPSRQYAARGRYQPTPRVTPAPRYNRAARRATARSYGKHKLYLQAGAFFSRGNAQRLTRRIKSMRVYSARIHTGRKNNKPLYRVRIGPLGSVRQLDKLSLRLNRAGIRNTRVVVD